MTEHHRTGAFRRLPIATDWQRHLLDTEAEDAPDRGWLRAAHELLFPTSFLYRWIFTQLSVQQPELISTLGLGNDFVDVRTRRMKIIKKIPTLAYAFDGWNFLDDLDYDLIFFANEVPPIFEEAVRLTGAAIDEFVRHASHDGFKLVALVGPGVRGTPRPRRLYRRAWDQDGYFTWLAELLEPRGVPLIDLRDYILGQHVRLADAHFSRDGHWSERGDHWAAEALLQFSGMHPNVCGAALSYSHPARIAAVLGPGAGGLLLPRFPTEHAVIGISFLDVPEVVR
jgi:hypothetical protein